MTENASLHRATVLSAVVLALPPLLAILAGLFPGSVPVPFAEVDDSDGIVPILLGLGVVMLVVNAGILYALHRFVRD